MAERHQFCNGIVSAPRPRAPPRGCYVKQLIHQVAGGTSLPWYSTPPSQGLPEKVFWGLHAGVVFGPVHANEEFESFISVKVPVPASLLSAAELRELPQVVWINVYTDRRYHRHGAQTVSNHYCEEVAGSEVQLWYDNGWKDTWVRDHGTLELR